MSSLNNLLFYLQTYQITIYFNVSCALVKYWIFSYMNSLIITVYFIRYSGAKSSSVNKTLTQTNLQVTFTIARYSNSILDRDTTLCFLFFHDTKLTLRKMQKPVVGRLPSGNLANQYLRNQQFWCVHNLNIYAFFQ